MRMNEWLEQDEERMLVRHCGWWMSLRGLATSANVNTVRVQVPRSQMLTRDLAALDPSTRPYLFSFVHWACTSL